jgi:hypothetical protein
MICIVNAIFTINNDYTRIQSEIADRHYCLQWSINRLIEANKIQILSAKLKSSTWIMKYEYIEVSEWSRKMGCPKVTQVSCWMFILLITCSRQTQSLVFDNTTDFVQKCQLECSFKKDYTTCGKYKVVKWLNTVVKEKVCIRCL